MGEDGEEGAGYGGCEDEEIDAMWRPASMVAAAGRRHRRGIRIKEATGGGVVSIREATCE